MQNTQQLLLIRYGELGLKGKNKSKFIKALRDNISQALHNCGNSKVRSDWGRLWVETDQPQQASNRLKQVFGIYSFSPVRQVEKNLEAIAEAAYQTLIKALPDGGKFKVETRRVDKTFPLASPEISKQVAAILFARLPASYQAEMHQPERTIQIEIRAEGAFVYGEVINGARGLPVGTGGKGLLLLSGGIDSPVAGWYALRRGVSLEAIHFHSFPFTGEKSKEKVVSLCKLLAKWQGAPLKLHVVHFTEIQKAIHNNCAAEYGITLMRRMMYRIAESLATKRRALALYTGESVGQVASQTLESLATIEAVAEIPVLRPLIGLDKEDIVNVAQKIGSYETSILPYEDCCTIFLPKFPKIRPTKAEAEHWEKELAIEELIADALAKTEVLVIS